MSRKRRKRKGFMDDFFGSSLFEDVEKMFETGKGLEGGYSVNVTQTPQGTKVRVKAGKDTDIGALRRRLQQQYPGAEIEIEGGRPLIREISTKPLDTEKKEKGVWFKPE